MGGYGSGRWGWHRAKRTADEAKRVSISRLNATFKEIAAGRLHTASGRMSWTQGRQETGNINWYCHKDSTANSPVLTFSYFWGREREPVTTVIRTTTTRSGGGARRWWLKCPHCGRRVGVLYLPGNEKFFACRVCHNLTYKSCQESGQYKGLWKRLGIADSPSRRLLNRIGHRRLRS